MGNRLIALTLFCLFWFTSNGYAETIYVDDTLASNCTTGVYDPTTRECSGGSYDAYRFVQDAINVAVNGDTIKIQPGAFSGYFGPNPGGKAITITSETANANDVIITGAYTGLLINNGETSSTVITHLTFRSSAASIFVGSASTPEIRDVNVCGVNSVSGIACKVTGSGSEPLLERLYVYNNSNSNASTHHVLIETSAAPIFKSCIIAKCSGVNTGISAESGTDPTFQNCTITGIGQTYDAQIYGGTITNTIIWTAAVDNTIDAGVTCTYCDIRGHGSGTGNIDAVPLFENPAAGDFNLKCKSWCYEAGTDLTSTVTHYYDGTATTAPMNMGALGGCVECEEVKKGFGAVPFGHVPWGGIP